MIEKFNIVKTVELNEQIKIQLFELWNSEYPEKISFNSLDELDNYLEFLDNLNHFLVLDINNLVLGWALSFNRNDEVWFAIILAEKIQGKGYGRKILDELKQVEPVLNGWVIDHNDDKKSNGQSYLSPLNFYQKCGFEVQANCRLELDKISAVKIKWSNEKL